MYDKISKPTFNYLIYIYQLVCLIGGQKRLSKTFFWILESQNVTSRIIKHRKDRSENRWKYTSRLYNILYYYCYQDPTTNVVFPRQAAAELLSCPVQLQLQSSSIPCSRPPLLRHFHLEGFDWRICLCYLKQSVSNIPPPAICHHKTDAMNFSSLNMLNPPYWI